MNDSATMTTDLFSGEDIGPPGLRYIRDALSREEETALVAAFAGLPFAPFQFHQYTGLRRVVSFGYKYDYTAQRVRDVEPLPDFLGGLRAKAGAIAQIDPQDLRQSLVTEYPEGAGIGWHRDKPTFDKVVAFSFGGDAILRFRRKAGTGWQRRTLRVEPCSAYVLEGPARSKWEHSIPAVAGLRYSVTFRNFVAMDISDTRGARCGDGSSNVHLRATADWHRPAHRARVVPKGTSVLSERCLQVSHPEQRGKFAMEPFLIDIFGIKTNFRRHRNPRAPS
jgi:alkylated DNA repair dioxygenase AlkB